MRGAVGYAGPSAPWSCPQVVVLILQHGEALIYAFFGAILHGAVPAIMPFLTELSPSDTARPGRPDRGHAAAAIVTYADFESEVRPLRKGPLSCVLIDSRLARRLPRKVRNWLAWSAPRTTWRCCSTRPAPPALQKGVALSHRAVLNQLERYAAGHPPQAGRRDRQLAAALSRHGPDRRLRHARSSAACRWC